MNTEKNERTRVEKDLIGERNIPADALYGIQTLRGIENFRISHTCLKDYPLLIKGMAITKMAAAEANYSLHLLDNDIKNAIIQAFDVVKDDDWFKECYVWLYRGAWMEWEIEKVDMAVPVSPSELSIKRKAIYKHGSQNNGPAYPGDDPREFWQRAEDRNRNTADLYNKLGMAEYEAMEVFVRYRHGER